MRSSLGVGVSEWDQRLAKTLLPTKGKGRRSLGLVRRIRLSQRVYKVLERKTMRAGLSPRCRQRSNYAQDLRLRYTSKMQSDTRSLTGPCPNNVK